MANADQAVKDTDKLKLGEKGFWTSWIAKLLFTLISVKFWGLLAGTWVSTHLVMRELITGAEWMTFNTTVWALIFGMKEVFRIAEGRDKTEKHLAKLEKDSSG